MDFLEKIKSENKTVGEMASQRPWETDPGLLRIAPHVWYVGEKWVGCLLVKTKDGLVLIDTGMPGQLYQIFEGVRKLGFDPEKDVRLCLLTHAHWDHCGCMAAVQHICKPVMYMSPLEADWPVHPELHYASKADYVPYKVDRLYDYKTPIEFGGFRFDILHTPGHTVGTSSIFFDDTDEETGKTYRCGLHGGVGTNMMEDRCFKTAEEARERRSTFRANLKKWREIPVDICLFNHPGHIDALHRVKEDKNDYTPFADPSLWHLLIDRKLQELSVIEEKSIFGK